MHGLFPAEHVFYQSRSSNPGARSDRPAILYLTNKFCFPPNSGGAVRESKLLEPLLGRFDVHYVGFTHNFDADCANALNLVDRFGSITLLRHQEPDLPLDVTSFRLREHYSPFGEDLVIKLIDRIRPSTIHVEGCFLMRYVPRGLPCRIVLTEENIEFELDAGRSAVSGRKPPGAHTSDIVRRIELDAWRAADVCIFVTPEDERTAKSVIPELNTRCLENSVDGDLSKEAIWTSRSPSPTPTGLYVANYTWPPSEDGAYFLIDEVWPLILDIVPEAHLILAGTGMSAELEAHTAQAEQVTYVGPFEKFADVANGAHVFLCPLRFGGEARLK
ncbi:glycosyltransferase (plasmid) [Sinorhizobium sp. M103]|uniref:glycosyltransferase n=1 Tax=Sinorhizobium sp. M103 TaxID=2976821 RepID=UPI0023D85BEE|nr:glycosyltransferase [Sinorhizobium sp. M103]WEJ08638.1 glycosyltransferase [Sinorhizobium sp. M103]